MTESITIRLPSGAMRLLEEATKTGVLGTELEDVATYVMMRGIEDIGLFLYGRRKSYKHLYDGYQPKRRNSKKEEVAEAARAIIMERRKPVSRRDLCKALKERGLVIEGKDPEMVLGTMLWRMNKRVIRVKGGGYWLTEVSNEAASYDPATDDPKVRAMHMPAGEARRLSEDESA